jgi:hypothetical protein
MAFGMVNWVVATLSQLVTPQTEKEVVGAL